MFGMWHKQVPKPRLPHHRHLTDGIRCAVKCGDYSVSDPGFDWDSAQHYSVMAMYCDDGEPHRLCLALVEYMKGLE